MAKLLQVELIRQIPRPLPTYTGRQKRKKEWNERMFGSFAEIKETMEQNHVYLAHGDRLVITCRVSKEH